MAYHPKQHYTDDQLQAFCRRGVQAACTPLVDRYLKDLMIYCGNLTRNVDDGKDYSIRASMALVTEVCERKQHIEHVLPWLKQVAYRMVISDIRKRDTRLRGLSELLQKLKTDGADPDEESKIAAQQRIMFEEINQLPSVYRTAIMHRHVYERSVQEVGDVLQKSRSETYNILQLAKRMLVKNCRRRPDFPTYSND